MKLVRNNAVMLACMAAFFFVLLIIGLRISAIEDSQPGTAGGTVTPDSSAAASNLAPTKGDVVDGEFGPGVEEPDQAVSAAAASDNRASVARSNRLAETKNRLVREDLTRFASKREAVGEEVVALTTLLHDLSSNEAGRQLGQAHELLESYMSFEDRFQAAAKQYDTVRRELTLFEAEIEEQLELYPATPIPDSTASQLIVLGDSLEQVDLELKNCRLGLAALVREGAKYPVGESSLATAVENYLIDRESRQLQAVAEERRRRDQADLAAKIEDDQKLADAREAMRKEKVAAELIELEAEKAAARLAAEEKEKQVLLEAEFERDWPKIQRYLGPLFVKTTRQPGVGKYVETKEPMPVSLTALHSIGLSNSDISQACIPLLMFFSSGQAGGRGQGPYPSYYVGGALSPEYMAAIRPAYDLLDKYGELLVEKGLLAK